jgi:V8-like Glu-specific endopeptidase
MKSPFPLARIGLLSLLFATSLAAGQAFAQSQSMPGSAPMMGTGAMAPLLPPSSAPKAGKEAGITAKKASPMQLLDALSGVVHSRGGTEQNLPVPPGLRDMIQGKASGIVRPAGGGGDGKTGGEPKQITPTTNYPYTTVGMLSNGCTGVLVGKHFVLTAGFCVYDTEKKTWDEKIDFWPAVDAGKAPYGSVRWKSVSAPRGFTEQGDFSYNFALIELDSDIGDQTGWMGFGYDNNFPFKELTLTGFPAGVPDFTMWEVTCKVGNDTKATDPFVLYGCPGQKELQGANGAPLWVINKENNSPYVYGIHLMPYKGQYAGRRITQEAYEILLSWMQAPPSSSAAR